MNAIFLPTLVTDQPNDASTSIRHLEENESFPNADFQRKDLSRLMTLRFKI